MAQTVPAGLLGRYYAVRHSYGHYRSCGVTGTYSFSKEVIDRTPRGLSELLKHALYHTIQRYPALCYGLVEKNQDTEAHFNILKTIDWDEVVEIQKSTLPKEEQDGALSNLIGKAHEHLFKDQDRKPAWKVTILIHDAEACNTSTRVDVLFINHHAVGDGTSSAAFHKAFLGFLQQKVSQPDLQVNWPYKVPTTLPPIQFVEDACPLPPRSIIDAPSTNLIAPESQLDAWTASPPTYAHETFASRVKSITISPAYVSKVLVECRRLKTTVTGLLHSLVILQLSKAVPKAHGFRAVTPYSMRRFTGASDDEILNHISYISSDWKEDVISLARAASENSQEEDIVISNIAQQYAAEITEELENVPVRGPLATIEVSMIKDFDQFCRDGMKRKRGHTYELSNIGAVNLPDPPAGSEGLELEKLTFTQSGMVAGPAFGCSVISIRGKSLVVSLHWQEGIIEDEFVDQLAAYLERRLLAFGM